MQSKLSAKVKAVNASHDFANKLCEILNDHFQSLLGKKICLKDTNFTKSVKSDLPKFPETKEIKWLIYASERALMVKVSYYAYYQEYCSVSYERAICLGHILDGVLTELYPMEDFKSDYDEEQIAKQKEEYEIHIQKANEIRRNFLSLFMD